MAYEQVLAARAVDEGQYNSNNEQSVNPTSHCSGGTVFITTGNATLGPTLYKAGDSDISDDDMELFKSRFHKEEGNTVVKMDVVHQHKGSAIGTATRQDSATGSATSTTGSEGRRQTLVIVP